MSERTLKQLVGALAVVAGLWAVSLLFSSGSGSIATSGEVARFFGDLDVESVDAIHIEGPWGPVELARTDDGWTANGHPGDQAAISRLLEVVAETTIGDLVASNPANHDRMGVSADSATVVTFDSDGVSRTLLLGDSGRRFGTAYVRLPDEDEVYLLDGDLRAQTGRRADDWRNRTMAAVDSTRITRIEVERVGDSYALVRGDSLWTIEDGSEANRNAVNGVLMELSGLVASGFLEAGDSIAELERQTTTTAYSDTGEVLAEITIGSGETDRWARTMTDEYIYRVSSFRAGRVAPTREAIEPAGS